MRLNEYQKFALGTAIYYGQGTPNGLVYTTLGLVGEPGEFADYLKKCFRETGPRELNDEERLRLKGELGDALWYIGVVAQELGFTLEEVAQHNVDKLKGRKERGTLHGEGEER